MRNENDFVFGLFLRSFSLVRTLAHGDEFLLAEPSVLVGVERGEPPSALGLVGEVFQILRQA